MPLFSPLTRIQWHGSAQLAALASSDAFVVIIRCHWNQPPSEMKLQVLFLSLSDGWERGKSQVGVEGSRGTTQKRTSPMASELVESHAIGISPHRKDLSDLMPLWSYHPMPLESAPIRNEIVESNHVGIQRRWKGNFIIPCHCSHHLPESDGMGIQCNWNPERLIRI